MALICTHTHRTDCLPSIVFLITLRGNKFVPGACLAPNHMIFFKLVPLRMLIVRS